MTPKQELDENLDKLLQSIFKAETTNYDFWRSKYKQHFPLEFMLGKYNGSQLYDVDWYHEFRIIFCREYGFESRTSTYFFDIHFFNRQARLSVIYSIIKEKNFDQLKLQIIPQNFFKLLINPLAIFADWVHDERITEYLANYENHNITGLHLAVAEGNKQAVSKILEICKQDDVNTVATLREQEEFYYTPLYIAIKKGDPEIIEMLKKHGASLDPALLEAARNNCIANAKELLNMGADPNSVSSSGRLLCILANRDDAELLQFLLTNKDKLHLNLDAAYAADTPLEWAISCENEHTAKLLIINGANVNIKNDKMNTPLHSALKSLIWQKERCRRDRRLSNIIEALLNAGADTNAYNNKRLTPLHYAIESGHTDIVEQVLNHGANVNCKGSYTPLGLAVLRGFTDIVLLLLTRKSNLDAYQCTGRTAIHVAIDRSSDSNFEIMHALITNGAKPYARDANWEQSPYYRASMNVRAAVDLFVMSYQYNHPALITKGYLNVFGHNNFNKEKGVVEAMINIVLKKTPFFSLAEYKNVIDHNSKLKRIYDTLINKSSLQEESQLKTAPLQRIN